MMRLGLLLSAVALLFTLLTGAGLSVGHAQAAGLYDEVCVTGSRANTSTVCKNKDNTSNPVGGNNGILVKAIQLIDLLIGIVAVIVIIIAGLQFIISSGDAGKVSKAKETILYAVVGLAVAVVAQGIIVFVVQKI
jgi:hypothetical protein